MILKDRVVAGILVEGWLGPSAKYGRLHEVVAGHWMTFLSIEVCSV